MKPDTGRFRRLAACGLLVLGLVTSLQAGTYVVVDTGQSECYDANRSIACPATGEPFYGQDAQHAGLAPAYQDNGDGTTTDLVTDLMWQKTPGPKETWNDVMTGASSIETGGFGDWRVPTIKELYSLMDFDGITGTSAAGSTPYLDTDFFDFSYGDTSAGERFIDAQYWSATEYVGTTMNGDPTVFGVNFADGRIKGYPKQRPGGGTNALFVRYVRGNPAYGVNDFVDNGDGTITDRATGLMWSQADSGDGMNWEGALAWVQERNEANHLGYRDWRLPDAKELQSLVDYTQAPNVTDWAAIDTLFVVSQLPDGDYPFFWTSTTHLDGPPDIRQAAAVYIAFGRATGFMEQPPASGNYQLLDVHGAGAQRSDPKAGDPDDYPFGRGPQGDVIRIYNHVRCVRDAEVVTEPAFLRGDANSDGELDISDAVRVLQYLFDGGVALSCLDTGDANDDGLLNIADAVVILGYLFAHTESLPETCGSDLTVDELGCVVYEPCP